MFALGLGNIFSILGPSAKMRNRFLNFQIKGVAILLFKHFCRFRPSNSDGKLLKVIELKDFNAHQNKEKNHNLTHHCWPTEGENLIVSAFFAKKHSPSHFSSS